jgi:hypothetical protein
MLCGCGISFGGAANQCSGPAVFDRGSDGNCSKCDEAEGNHVNMDGIKFCVGTDDWPYLGLFDRGSDGNCTKCGEAEGNHGIKIWHQDVTRDYGIKICPMCHNCYLEQKRTGDRSAYPGRAGFKCCDGEDERERDIFAKRACEPCKIRRKQWGGGTTQDKFDASPVFQEAARKAEEEASADSTAKEHAPELQRGEA